MVDDWDNGFEIRHLEMVEVPRKPRLIHKFLMEYAAIVQRDLDEFVEGSQTHHAVTVIASPTITIARIMFFPIDQPTAIQVEMTEALAQEYPTDQLIVENENTVIVAHPSSLHYWSNVQAWIDASDVIGFVLGLERPLNRITRFEEATPFHRPV